MEYHRSFSIDYISVNGSLWLKLFISLIILHHFLHLIYISRLSKIISFNCWLFVSIDLIFNIKIKDILTNIDFTAWLLLSIRVIRHSINNLLRLSLYHRRVIIIAMSWKTLLSPSRDSRASYWFRNHIIIFNRESKFSRLVIISGILDSVITNSIVLKVWFKLAEMLHRFLLRLRRDEMIQNTF